MKKLICFIVLLLTIPIFSQQVEWKTVTWTGDTALSTEVNLGGTNKPIIFAVASSFTSDTVSYQVYVDNLGTGTWCNLYDEDGAEIISVITTTVNFAITLKPQWFAGISRIKIRQGTAASPDEDGEAISGALGIRKY